MTSRSWAGFGNTWKVQGEKFADFLDRLQCSFCIGSGGFISRVPRQDTESIQEQKKIRDQFDTGKFSGNQHLQRSQVVRFGKGDILSDQISLQIFFGRLMAMKADKVRNRFLPLPGQNTSPIEILLRLVYPRLDLVILSQTTPCR